MECPNCGHDPVWPMTVSNDSVFRINCPECGLVVYSDEGRGLPGQVSIRRPGSVGFTYGDTMNLSQWGDKPGNLGGRKSPQDN